MAEIAPSDKLRTLLTEAFEGCTIELERGSEQDRLVGWVIWEGFSSLGQVDRQNRLRSDVLDKLTADERAAVGPILTLTPHEASDDDEEEVA